ncbi:MAG: SPOR domain-containing protein [Proteobacteria bacterium]|nr:SPOR domain-containing protein [Pseudomonadota bacterium]
MRLLFLLLLVANLGFFAWMRFLAAPDPAVDRQPLSQQLDPGKLRIVPETELAKAQPAAPAKPAAAPTPVPIACLESGSFSPGDATRAAQRLEPLALGARLAQYRGEETAGWWVYIPPQANRAGALRKTAELKKLGVDDYFVVQDAGRERWAVSLGVFRAEEAAKAHLDALRAKGVRSAVIGQRETQVPKVWFQVRGVDPALHAQLQEITRDLEGATLRDCAAR